MVVTMRTVGVGADGCLRNLRYGLGIFSTFSADAVGRLFPALQEISLPVLLGFLYDLSCRSRADIVLIPSPCKTMSLLTGNP